jgi:hypothetical protein
MVEEVVVDERSGGRVRGGQGFEDGGEEGQGGLGRVGVLQGDDAAQAVEDIAFVAAVEELFDLGGGQRAGGLAWPGVAGGFEGEVAGCTTRRQ